MMGWTERDDAEFAIYRFNEHSGIRKEMVSSTASELLADYRRGRKKSVCVHCRTALTDREGIGWTHDVGFMERGGCQRALPAEEQ